MSTAVENIDIETAAETVQASIKMRPGPLFVVGMWRSGTSLLYALLNQHPQIGLMYESDFFLLTTLFSLPRKNGSWIAKLDSWNGALTRHKIDPEALPKDVSDMRDAFRAAAQQYARKKGARIWGCKSPNYYDCMNLLADWFPEAKFIVIWRDPADVCRSIVRAAEKSRWFARPGMNLRALLGCQRMKQEADALVQRGAAIHQLQYDDLVQQPQQSLRAICDFIGVEYDAKMNTLEGADRSAIYNGAHHAGVKSSLIMTNHDRPEVLAPEFKSKIERYVTFWRKQYNGKWPANAALCEGTQPASAFERTCDQIQLTLLRGRDALIPALYSFVPTAVWQKYRQVKSQYQGVAVNSNESELLD